MLQISLDLSSEEDDDLKKLRARYGSICLKKNKHGSMQMMPTRQVYTFDTHNWGHYFEEDKLQFTYDANWTRLISICNRMGPRAIKD